MAFPTFLDKAVNFVEQFREALDFVNYHYFIFWCQMLFQKTGITAEGQVDRTIE